MKTPNEVKNQKFELDEWIDAFVMLDENEQIAVITAYLQHMQNKGITL